MNALHVIRNKKHGFVGASCGPGHVVFGFQSTIDAKLVHKSVPEKNALVVKQIAPSKFALPVHDSEIDKKEDVVVEIVDTLPFLRYLSVRTRDTRLFVVQSIRLHDNEFMCLEGFVLDGVINDEEGMMAIYRQLLNSDYNDGD